MPFANIRVMPADADGSILLQQFSSREAQSDEDGLFAIPYLDPLDYRVLVVCGDERLVSVQTLALDTEEQEHHIRLEPGMSLKGTVLIEGGGAPESCMVMAFCEAEQMMGGAQVDVNGAYTLSPALPPDRYLLFVLAPDYSVGAARLDLREDTVQDFVLSPPGSVVVTLKGPEHLRAGRTVRIEDEQGQEVVRLQSAFTSMGFGGMFDAMGMKETDADGKTSIHGVPPGQYRVFVEGYDVYGRVAVSPLETAAVTLDVGTE